MRGLALVVLVAACGGDAGVLLDVQTGDANVKTVEVFVAKSQTATRMGMPPAASTKTTQGPVYETIDHAVTSVGGDGRVRVLLQRGEVTDVPAILVLGLDANNTPSRYAVVTDPSGSIALPATHEVRLVVQLEPASGTTIANARMPAGNAGTRVARWSSESRGSDDAKGPCVALVEDASGGTVTGTFFGPQGDTDCDAAQPECDDAWYLRVKDPGKCATDTAPNVETMNACRIGDSAACRDGVQGADGTCVPQTVPTICVPGPICDQCRDLVPSCVAQNLTSDNTMHIECTVDAHTENGTTTTLCANRATTIDVSPLFGNNYACTGTSSFVDPMNPTAPLMPDLALASGNGPRVTFNCHQLQFQLDVTDNTTAPITNNMDTHGAILVSVGVPNMPATNRLLVVPIKVVTNIIGTNTCDTAGMTCTLVPDQGQTPDPIWHCAGG